MNRVRLAAAVVLAVCAAAPSANARDFFSVLRDLPLMPGLAEQPDASVVFDHEKGQATIAVASGPVEPAAVRLFYRSALPPLGWEPECAASRCPLPDRYRRGGEVLELDLATAHGDTAARFLLTRNLSAP